MAVTATTHLLRRLRSSQARSESWLLLFGPATQSLSLVLGRYALPAASTALLA